MANFAELMGVGCVRFYDLFSGIGGFHLGLTRAGHECVGACEKEDWKRAVYSRRFSGIKIDRDARKLDPDSMPDFEILSGGFPCQAFSNAGKRKGLADPRGDICFEVARIAKRKRPRHLLLENVPGLLSHDKGRTFAAILASLDDAGYDAEWQVLFGKNWLPQDRPRLFIVGHLRGSGQGPKEIFPLGDSEEETVVKGAGKAGKKMGKRGPAAVTTLTASYHKSAYAGETYLHMLSDWRTNGDYRIYSPDGLARTLQSTHGKTGLYMFQAKNKKPAGGRPAEGNAEPKLQQINDPEYGPYRVYSPEGLARTLMGRAGGMGAKTGLYAVPASERNRTSGFQKDGIGPQAVRDCPPQAAAGPVIPVKHAAPSTDGPLFREDGDSMFTLSTSQNEYVCMPVLTVNRLKTRQNGKRFKTDGEPAFTITSIDRHGIFDGIDIRRLMPVECELLMGFPRDWTAWLSDNRRYISLGESVMVPIIEHLGRLLNE